MTYWWNSITSITIVIFNNSPGLGNSFLKFHDFRAVVCTGVHHHVFPRHVRLSIAMSSTYVMRFDFSWISRS